MVGNRSGGRRGLYASGLALAVLFGCSGPAEPEDDAVPVEAEAVMEMLRGEAILDYAPGGVEDEGIVESPAEGIALRNKISRKFIAPTDAGAADRLL